MLPDLFSFSSSQCRARIEVLTAKKWCPEWRERTSNKEYGVGDGGCFHQRQGPGLQLQPSSLRCDLDLVEELHPPLTYCARAWVRARCWELRLAVG